jgi:S-ribosylhomocysteine lyase LuxS involved in autoinducer biosynthesis
VGRSRGAAATAASQRHSKSKRSFSMFARMLAFLTVMTLVGTPAAARSADAKSTSPTFVVRLDSINNLLEDVKYLAELAGQKDKVDESLKFVKTTVEDQKIDKAIDFTRPLGMYGTVNPDNPVDSPVVLLVPVADEKGLLDLLGNFGMMPDKGEDGVYSVQAPFPPIPIYFRFANKYAYITAQNKAGVAKESILEPGKVFPAGKTTTFSVSLRLDQIPDDVKKMAISQMEEHLNQEKQKEIPGETKIQSELRRKMTDAMGQRMAQLIQDAGELAFSFDINRQANRLNGEMTFSGKPGSSLAKEIADAGKTESLFGELISSKAAINILLHTTFPEEARKAIEPAIDAGFKEAKENEKDPGKRELAEKIFEAIKPSLTAGELDLAFSFRGPSKENHYTFLGAIKLKDGQKVEEAVKEVLNKAVPESDKQKIHLDAEKSGEFNIHKLDAHKDFDEKTRAILGDHAVYLAFRSDAVLVSGGARGLETIKEALKTKSKVAPAGLFEISMSHLAPLIMAHAEGHGVDKEKSEQNKKLVHELFKGDDDKIRATLEGGKELKGSFTMSASVIKFIGQMATHEEHTFNKVEPKIKPSKKKTKKEEEKKEEDK